MSKAKAPAKAATTAPGVNKPIRHLYLIDGSGYIFRAYHALPPMNRPDGTPINAVFGFSKMLGQLLDDPEVDHVAVILDADGANQLINPIDGSVITKDVYGNPRTAFGTRDIGAVQGTQQVPGPLPIFGLGAALGWSRRLRNRVRKSR